jgi:GNAT superfamily N-acetyltransferase
MFQLPNCLVRDALSTDGWTVVHRYTRLNINLDAADIPKPARANAGVRLRAATSDLDRRTVHSVLESAIAGHWNHQRLAFTEFERAQRQRDGYDPQLWWLAAWLGVLDAFRGRGIGTLLLGTVFQVLRERGHLTVGVDVDTHSTTNAVNVYKTAGMMERGTADQWRKTYA